MMNQVIMKDLFQFNLKFPPDIQFTDDQFFVFCQMNRDLNFEKTDKGEVSVMSPAGGETSWKNSLITSSLTIWAINDGSGIVFDSSGGFILPNGAIRSPDAAWVKRTRLEPLSPEQKSRFIPLCPDVVIELRSPSDNLSKLQDKMKEYIENGAILGWLIDPNEKQVFVYHAGKEVECLKKPDHISGEDILPGFVLDLTEIWKPGF